MCAAALAGASFADGWQIESIEPATIESIVSPVGVLAWLATIVRL